MLPVLINYDDCDVLIFTGKWIQNNLYVNYCSNFLKRWSFRWKLFLAYFSFIFVRESYLQLESTENFNKI